jgi:hypothetical protein
MGLEQTVTFPGAAPPWRDAQDLLAKHGFPVQLRMIDGELAFPDEVPPEFWRELRVSGTAGMVTLRRGSDRVTLVTWGNADPILLQMRNALAWAFAQAGGGQVESEQGRQTADEFMRKADVPAELRAP